MPAKNKAGSNKPKDSGSAATTQTPVQAAPKKPQTIRELEWERYWLTDPLQKIVEEQGLSALTPIQKRNYYNLRLIRNPGEIDKLSKKSQKELWKQLNEASLPLRTGVRPTEHKWGFDKYGRDIGDYTVDEYNQYAKKRDKLYDLKFWSGCFKTDREKAGLGLIDWANGEKPYTITEEDIETERQRRRDMALLQQELYGVTVGSYVTDPEWDDVAPMYSTEPEGALAAIAYPEDYVEAMAYLRAVMSFGEKTPRCLKLTEHIINMNPAHYTVWLYRFDIIKALGNSIPDELLWLNEVALDKLKNYQIWHHRQLLLDEYHQLTATDSATMDAFVDAEMDFIDNILKKDNKNIHVWSYRQYIVQKLGLWDTEHEMQSVEDWIEDDVRNNSAWSHRFFLVFTNPRYTTPKSHATEHDPKIPAEIIDREIEYAQARLRLAPQNQSPWNYLRGVLVKGGRPLNSVQDFVTGFIENLGEDTEEIKSSHALDLLSEILQELGDKDMALLCLKRLGEKWDPIRKGYWEYRARMLNQ